MQADRKPPFYILKPDHGTPATDLIAAHRDALARVERDRSPEPPKSPASFADFQAGFHSPSRG